MDENTHTHTHTHTHKRFRELDCECTIPDIMRSEETGTDNKKTQNQPDHSSYSELMHYITGKIRGNLIKFEFNRTDFGLCCMIFICWFVRIMYMHISQWLSVSIQLMISWEQILSHLTFFKRDCGDNRTKNNPTFTCILSKSSTAHQYECSCPEDSLVSLMS